MGWWPFATKLETADTAEVTALNNYAPPPYSAVGFLKRLCALLVVQLMQYLDLFIAELARER
jgi:hypothetical protein